MIGRAFLLVIALFLVSCAPVIKPLEPTVTPTVVRETPTASPAPSATGTPTTARVIASESLHVRVRPGEHERVLGYLFNSDAVTLTGLCRDGWVQIVWKSGRAFVKAKYLSDNRCTQ
jgi:hypothetical protein